MSGLELTSKSIFYFFSHRITFVFILFGAFFNAVLNLSFLYLSDYAIFAYLQEIVDQMSVTFWILWLTVYIIHEITDRYVSIKKSFFIAVTRTAKGWWFFAWLIVLQILRIFSMHLPHYYTDHVAFLLFSFLFSLFLLQMLLNFFFIPLIADDIIIFWPLVIHAIRYCKQTIRTVLGAIFCFIIVFFIVVVLIGSSSIGLSMLFEKLFASPISPAIMRIIIIQLIAFTVYALLAIAQSILYGKVHYKLPHD